MLLVCEIVNMLFAMLLVCEIVNMLGANSNYMWFRFSFKLKTRAILALIFNS